MYMYIVTCKRGNKIKLIGRVCDNIDRKKTKFFDLNFVLFYLNHFWTLGPAAVREERKGRSAEETPGKS